MYFLQIKDQTATIHRREMGLLLHVCVCTKHVLLFIPVDKKYSKFLYKFSWLERERELTFKFVKKNWGQVTISRSDAVSLVWDTTALIHLVRRECTRMEEHHYIKIYVHHFFYNPDFLQTQMKVILHTLLVKKTYYYCYYYGTPELRIFLKAYNITLSQLGVGFKQCWRW